jgi:hypothetical protein
MVNVTIFDFLAVIEVKNHRPPNLRFAGANVEVFYSDWKSATDQSDCQARSARDYIENALGWRPSVCNLLLFPNRVREELPSISHNFLVSNSNFDDFLERLCLSKKLSVRNNSWKFASNALTLQNL